jgi:hypothetical protein
MSIKTDAVVIRDEVIPKANTAVRVGTNLVAIADDLVAKQAAIDLKQNKPSEGAFVDGDKTKLDGITAGATPDQVLPTSGVDFDPVGTDNSDDNAVNSLYSGLATSKQDALDVVGQAEAEAGTATAERIWTAERVKQAIVALGGSVDDTAYGVSWNGVTTKAPSQNALYDFIESQVFKVDESSNIVPIFWGGNQIQYDAYFNITDFPSGVPNNYFTVITDGAVSPTNASDIVNTPSGNLVATDVQGALNELQAELDTNISFDSTSSTRLANTSGTNTGDQILTGLDYEPTKGVDDNYVTDAEKVVIGNTSGTNTGDNAANTLYSGLVSATTANVKAINDRVLEPNLTGLATYAIDYSLAETFFLAITQATSLTELNLPSSLTSKVITIHVSGNFALTYPAAWDVNITGAYAAGTGLTTITVEYVATSTPFYKVLIVQ